MILKKITLYSVLFLSISGLIAQRATELKPSYTLDSAQIKTISLFMEALRLKSLGMDNEALSYFNRVISIDPKNHAAHFEAAKIDAAVANYEEALSKSKRAYEQNKSNTHYREFYINQLTKSGKIDEALEVIQAILKSEKSDDLIKMQYAYLISLSDNPKKAISILSELDKGGEPNEALSYEKIKIYLNQNDFKNAEIEFKRLVQLNPGDTRYLGNLAEFYLKIKKIDEADKVFNAILVQEPNNVNALLYKVQYHQLKKDEDSYRKTISQLIDNKELNLDTKITLIADKFAQGAKLDSNDKKYLVTIGQKLIVQYPDEARSHQIMGDMHYISLDYVKAAGSYRKSLSIQNSEFNVWQNLFYALTSMRNFQELADSTNSALDLFPASAAVFFYNGVANSQLNKHDLAEKSFKRGLKFVGENRALEIQLLTSLGETYQKLKRFMDSDKSFEQAIKLDADNAYTLNNFAYFLSLRKDKLQEAKIMSKKSLDLEKENASFLDTYAWINFQLENYEEAKYYQEQALKFGKDDMSTIYEHYGDIMIKLHDVDTALKYWKKAQDAGSKNKSLSNKISTRSYLEYQD